MREITTDVGLFIVANSDQVIPNKIEVFSAIWDTGATNTAIASSVVKRMGIQPITFTQVGTGGGPVIAPVYLINIVLPDNFLVPNIRVTELKDLNNCDVLVGMDIISLGDFAITNLDGKTCFSFRIPSLEEIDLVPSAINHNKFLKSKASKVIEMAKARKLRAKTLKNRRKGKTRKKNK